MSSTRRADTGSPLRQERYASDPAFNDSLKASAVARKCSLLTNPAHRELCLQLQYASMQPGGLEALATDFLKRYGDRIGSKTMREQSGMKTFNADLVRKVRDELEINILFEERFPLKGELQAELADLCPPSTLDYWADPDQRVQQQRRKERARIADMHPTSYSARDFIEYCLEHAESHLEQWLVDFCLDPHTTFKNPPPYFHDLERSLLDYFKDRCTDSMAGKIVTSIGKQINDALDYAWEEKVLIHINGVARMGKTTQVKQWCDSHPGRVRYVQIPSGNDDISFFRAVARALGTASGSAMKTTQIKRQIEDAIQDACIMLCLDESHYLWPQYKDVRSSPRRINWLLTEVVNKGIPVALVTTPQFDVSQKAIVNGSGWASEQLDGRIAYRLDLPATLPESDLAAIARHYLPEADKQVLNGLCAYAEASGKYLAGIEAVAKRARFLARKAGRSTPGTSELKIAMEEVDPALVNLKSQTVREEPECKPTAKAKQRPCRTPARAVSAPEKQLVSVN